MSKVIGIVGSRSRDTAEDYQKCVCQFKNVYKIGDRLVSGGCPKGGDRFAEAIAKDFGLTITVHYPNWKRNGKSAGFRRNAFISQDCDVLIAMVSEDRKGGTEDTVKKAIKLGKQVILI